MLMIIRPFPGVCLNCGGLISAYAPCYSDLKGAIICEPCADTLPPDETEPEGE